MVIRDSQLREVKMLIELPSPPAGKVCAGCGEPFLPTKPRQVLCGGAPCAKLAEANSKATEAQKEAMRIRYGKRRGEAKDVVLCDLAARPATPRRPRSARHGVRIHGDVE